MSQKEVPSDTQDHRRRSIRLTGYDYSETGAYFVTICTQDRRRVFGHVLNEQVELSPAGQMVEDWWNEVPSKFPPTEPDEFIVMPDHLHAILIIPAPDAAGLKEVRPSSASLSTMIQWFKTMTTNHYMREVKASGWAPFRKKLWQRNYYEHVIRDNEELDQCREYIMQNPLKWTADADTTEAPEWLSKGKPVPHMTGRTHRSAPTSEGEDS